MMVCSAALINVARKMQERYGQPFFEGSFYGITDTSEALRQTARLLVATGAPSDLITRTEALVTSEEARAWARLEPYKRRLKGKRILLYTGGVKSWSVVSALQEMGMEVIGTSVRKSTDEDKAKIHELFGSDQGEVDPHMYEAIPPREMYAMLARGDADIMLSGGRTQFIALKAKVPWLDINQERHHAFAGYDGMVVLVDQLARALENPVFAAARKPAPWDQGGVVTRTSPFAGRDSMGVGDDDLAADLVADRRRGAADEPVPSTSEKTPDVAHHLRKFAGADVQDLEEC